MVKRAVVQASAGETAGEPFKTVALVLQGGGALGSYQGGVYQALSEAGVAPNWVAGISIGAINTALIAGNPPEKRVARLREFWEQVSSPPLGMFGVQYNPALDAPNEFVRRAINATRAVGIATLGAPGFFTPRLPPPGVLPAANPAQLSYYDVSPVRKTLEKLVDFERLNFGGARVSVGAVNVATGDMIWFDNTTHKLDVRHILASGSLPPGFPATEIDGEYYWDGGIVSNTPLQWVLDSRPRNDTLAFQVDLWSAAGELPRDLNEAQVRVKDIQFASRSRAGAAQLMNAQRLRHAFRALHDRLPEELRATPEAQTLAEEAEASVYTIVELLYRARSYEGIAKDFEFSRRTMEEHWRAGFEDTRRALAEPDLLRRPQNIEGYRLVEVSSQDR